MIRVDNLTKRYGPTIALDGINLSVDGGELFGYLGPNGAGKTTTIRILTGLTRHTAGDAYLNGFHIVHDSLKAKFQCGLVPQSVNLDPELTVYENLDVHGRLFGMPAAERRSRINEMLTYVDLKDRRNSPVKKLSGGMKRRATIARALVHDPRILFLDEPTVGLDARIRRRIWALIQRIRQSGTTILLTTHHIEEAEFLANRVAFLDEGKIVAVDTPERLMSRLGAWAVDEVEETGMKTRFFNDRNHAAQYAAKGTKSAPFTVRRVNLEDAFLQMTGKKMQ